SEGLPDREEELEMTDALLRALAIAGQLALRKIGIAVQQLRGRASEAEEFRRVNAVSQIDPDRPNGSAVSNAETGGVNGVVEVLQVFLVETQRNVAQGGEHIPHIVKKDSLNVLSEKWKPQLDVIEESGIPPERK